MVINTVIEAAMVTVTAMVMAENTAMAMVTANGAGKVNQRQ